jgi:sugar phosphate isomerase/epimerase
MGKTTRRNFIKNAGIGVAGMSLTSLMTASTGYSKKLDPSAPESGNKLGRLNLGMASFTFREFPLDETLKMTKRLGLDRIAFKDFHLPMDSSDEEIIAVAEKTRAAGLDLYGCGVVYMKNEEEVKRAFHYAKTAGMKIIIGVPNHELLDMVNKMVDKHNIKVAIHNHGPTDKLYPTPESAYVRIKDLDPRIGLCLDIGHTKRAGVDPSESVTKFGDRLHDVEYKGSVSFEFEKDGKDPLPGVAESVGYVRGVLDAI